MESIWISIVRIVLGRFGIVEFIDVAAYKLYKIRGVMAKFSRIRSLRMHWQLVDLRIGETRCEMQ
jgi:hypothetical protein